MAAPAAAATKYAMKPVVITTGPRRKKSMAAELLLYRRQSQSNSDAQRAIDTGKSAGVEQSRKPGSVYSDSSRCPQVRSGKCRPCAGIASRSCSAVKDAREYV